MRIIDYYIKGQSVKFYLGDDRLTNWYGDDWDDTPYEHNAGSVYSEFIKATKTITFPFDSLVLEPSDGVVNSSYCKSDFVNRSTPCVIVVPEELCEDDWHDSFDYWVASDDPRIQKFYFGDKMDCEDDSEDGRFVGSMHDILSSMLSEYALTDPRHNVLDYALRCVNLVDTAKRL